MRARGPINEDGVPTGTGTDGVLLLYDWFKHMTTLSLVTLGGLLSILQTGDANVRPGVLGGIVTGIAVAGMLGFDGQSRILVAEMAGRAPPKWLSWHRRIAVASYGIGVGVFLTLVVESVS